MAYKIKKVVPLIQKYIYQSLSLRFRYIVVTGGTLCKKNIKSTQLIFFTYEISLVRFGQEIKASSVVYYRFPYRSEFILK